MVFNTRILLCTWLLSVAAAVDEEPNYAEILDQCERTATSVEDCQELIFQSPGVNETKVKVVVVHPRTLNDTYYNQVVIPVDYQGLVLGSPPSFNSMVYYPFEWRGQSALGTRPIGPFNCTGMGDVACCDSIMAEVADRDVNDKFIDCWLEESFRKTTEGELIEVFRNPFDNSINEINVPRLKRLEEREENERMELIQEIANFGGTVHRQTFAQFASKTRHALRGYPAAQGVHYILKMQLRQVQGGPDAHVQIANNTALEEVLPLISSSLEHLGLEGGLHRFGGVTEGVNRDVIVLKTIEAKDGDLNATSHVVGETAFLDLTEDV